MVEKFTKKISLQLNDIQHWLQNILEKSDLKTDVPGIAQPTYFEVSTDLSQIGAWRDGLPRLEPARTECLFSRMIPYFNSGILFAREKNLSWSSRCAFQEGVFYPFPKDSPLLSMSLPEKPLTEILKLKYGGALTDLTHFGFLKTDQQAFAFRNHPDFYFVVISALPEVWLKSHLQAIHQRTLELSAEL